VYHHNPLGVSMFLWGRMEKEEAEVGGPVEKGAI